MANPTMPVSSEMMRKCVPDAGGRAAFTSRCYAVNRPYDRELELSPLSAAPVQAHRCL